MRTPMISLVFFASLGAVSAIHATDMEGPMSPCSGVEIVYFEQSSYALIQEDSDDPPLIYDFSNDEFELGEYTYQESELGHSAPSGIRSIYARGTQKTRLTENLFNVVNENYSYARYYDGANLTTMSTVYIIFAVDDNLESESGFSLSPSRHHSVWLDMSLVLRYTGELENLDGLVPGSKAVLLGPDGLVYFNSVLLTNPSGTGTIYDKLEVELTPGYYILVVDVVTQVVDADGAAYHGDYGTGYAKVDLAFSETASEGDVGVTLLSQYREASTNYDSLSETGPCEARLHETSGSDAWSYQDSDIRSLNTYGAFYNFARGNRSGLNQTSDGHLSVEFRLEEDASMDVLLRGTYEVHKSIGNHSEAGYMVRVEDLSSGDLVYLKSERYRTQGSGGINTTETTMLPAGDYRLEIETFASSQKRTFFGRGRLDAAMSLAPSVSFWN